MSLVVLLTAGLTGAIGRAYSRRWRISFAPPREVRIGNWNKGGPLALADLNGDGKLDAIFVSSGGPVVLLGDGKGGLAVGGTVSNRDRSAIVVPVDVDGDGRVDLVTLPNQGDGLSIFKGTGGGRFGEPIPVKTDDETCAVCVADLDADGHLDLVTAHESFHPHNAIHVRYGDGHGRFERETLLPLFDDETAQTSSGGSPGYSLVVTDLDGDGLPDVAAASFYFDHISIFRNQGKGRFAPRVDYPCGKAPCCLTALSDRDGHVDLAVVESHRRGAVSILENDGSGHFARPVQLTIDGADELTSLSAADLNGDGLPDLVVSHWTKSWILLGTGGASFRPPIVVPAGVGSAYEHVGIGDLDGDGKPDLVFGREDDAVFVVLQR